MINANDRGETIDPMSAHQFAAGIGQLVRLMIEKIDSASK